MYVHGLVYTHQVPLLCQLRGPKINDTWVAMSMPRTLIFISNTTLHKGNQGFLNKWLIIINIYILMQKHLLVPEMKAVLKQNKNTIMGICQSGREANWKSSQCPKLEKFVQLNKILLDFNTNYNSKYPWIRTNINKWLTKEMNGGEQKNPLCGRFM